jgi:hypothetical protein
MEGAMSFREKSAVITILALLLTYGAYAVRVKSGPMSTPEAVGFLSVVILAQVVIMIVAHIAVAVMRRPEARDERDQVADLRGARNGYFALATGLVAAMWLALMGAPPLTLVNAMLGALVAAEVVRYGSQLVYYRTGV